MVRLQTVVDTERRYLGWDLIKFFSFLAIIIFHFQWIVWYTLEVPSFILDQPLGKLVRVPTEFYARVLSFSGFTIVFMAGLNQGQTGKNIRFRRWLFVFLLLAWVLFTMLIFGVQNFHLAWDVYPLLFLGLLTASLLQGHSVLVRRMLGFAGLLMLFIPFWNLESDFSDSFVVQHILVGNCKEDYADWPILPWIGLVWFGFMCGGELKDSRSKHGRFLEVSKLELTLWALLLLATPWQFGPFFNVKLGYGFACHVFRFPWDVFWSHFVWPLFFFRISIDQRVQHFLQANRLVKWITSLSMVKNFWLAYILHFAYIHLLRLIFSFFDFEASDLHFAVLWCAYVSLIPLIEYFTRWSEIGLRLVSKAYQSRVS